MGRDASSHANDYAPSELSWFRQCERIRISVDGRSGEVHVGTTLVDPAPLTLGMRHADCKVVLVSACSYVRCLWPPIELMYVP